MLNGTTIKNNQIISLRSIATENGDKALYASCNTALAGDQVARQVCADALNAIAAQFAAQSR